MAIPTVDGVFGTSEYTVSFEEDQNVDYIIPGYGGQAYDVEYLGLYVTSDRLYFGLQTGIDIQLPVTATGYSQPGDLALDIGGNGTYDYGIRFWEYDASTSSPTLALYDASTWLAVDFLQHSDSGPWRVNTIDQSTTLNNISSGNFDIAFGTGLDGFGNPTNVLEGWILLSDLGFSSELDQPITANWTMKCGNDYGNITSAPVPEPATMLLLGTGLIGLAGVGRRKLGKRS